MSADPKTPLDESREALAKHYKEWCDHPTGCGLPAGHPEEYHTTMYPVDEMAMHLRATLAEAAHLTAENGRLREALTELTAERDAYKRAKAENDERFMLERDAARRERDEARQQLAEERARVAPVADTGDCRTCKWADTVVCHHPEGKRKNSPVWTWCAHALAEDLMTRLGTSPPCPGYTRKES